MEQRNVIATGTLAPDIAAALEKRCRADFILSNFPIYWFGMPVPAILKGWIDRVFASGVCYGGRRIHKHGRLAGKRACSRSRSADGSTCSGRVRFMGNW